MKGRIGFDLAVGLGLRGLGAVSGFVLLWLIAKVNGSEAVGAYQLGLTTATMLAVISVAGLDFLIIREAAVIVRRGTIGDLRETFTKGRRFILCSGTACALLMLVGGLSIYALADAPNPLLYIILAFSPAVLLLALLRHSNALLRSQGSVLLSQSLEGVLYTSIAAGVIAVLWLANSDVEPIALPLAYLAGLALATGISLFAARRLSRNWGEGTAQIDIPTGLRVTGAPILMTSGEWLTLLAIGAIAGLSDAGIYRTAFMFCLLFQLVNASFSTMAGPHIAKASAAGDRAGVMGITHKVGLIGLVMVAPLAALCLVLPELLLGLFGEEFIAGALALQILAAAQTINVVFGPVGAALIMVGRERQLLKIEVAATSLAVILALALIPVLGFLGAAIGFACATILRNAASRFILSRWHPTPQPHEASA
ncbi:polysaccharide biosynthesis C-terminal domain-containing protein [uncultured Erythrobacter sp.]|uniref:lipopolysaccharide biosynthesis protein n=1 Tax=uncultured Erythrobacter sp. TaxID=263913 RepID=UPI00262E1B2E|nr:polysaccharide biosynthesis C-terminal domain-containing protein [uncultured Erythrobacter sp.]